VLPDPGCYEERDRVTGRDAIGLTAGLLAIGLGFLWHTQAIFLVIGVVLTTVTVIVLARRQLAFCADHAGVLLAGRRIVHVHGSGVWGNRYCCPVGGVLDRGEPRRRSPHRRRCRSRRLRRAAPSASPRLSPSCRLARADGGDQLNGSSRWLKSQVFWVMPEQVLLSRVPGQPPLSRWIAQMDSRFIVLTWAKLSMVCASGR